MSRVLAAVAVALVLIGAIAYARSGRDNISAPFVPTKKLGQEDRKRTFHSESAESDPLIGANIINHARAGPSEERQYGHSEDRHVLVLRLDDPCRKNECAHRP